jgi:hypothetical protein
MADRFAFNDTLALLNPSLDMTNVINQTVVNMTHKALKLDEIVAKTIKAVDYLVNSNINFVNPGDKVGKNVIME